MQLRLSSGSDAPPAVPSFWDPKAVVDRPKSLPDKIQFVASDDFPPFVFRDPNGKLTGFNVDLTRAICEVLGSSCALKIVPFEDVARTVVEGGADAAIAGLAPTKALNSDLAFTRDYLKLPGRFAVLESKLADFNERSLGGKSIGVVAGSRHESFALRFWPEAILHSYPSSDAARAALVRGDVQAVFDSGLSLSIWLASEGSNGCCAFTGGPWLEPGYFDQGLSIAMRRTEPQLAEALNYGLRKVAEDGVFEELYLRYFPISFF